MFSFSTAVFLSTVFSSALCSPVADLVSKLRLDSTAVNRLNDLPDDKQFVFDFFNSSSGVVTGAAGHTVAATSGNFPAVVGNGVAMTVGFLGACAMNTPHTHPRATEINFSVNGTLRTGLLTENGARFVVNELPPGSMTVFPQVAVHFEVNNNCEPAMFVAAFNGEDPGVLQLAQRLYGLPVDIIEATLGGLGVQEVEGLAAKIPDNIAAGTDECLKRCGLTRPAQPTAQHQPRVSGNTFPTGGNSSDPVSSAPSSNPTGPANPAASYTTSAPRSDSSSAGAAQSSAAVNKPIASNGAVDVPKSSSAAKSTL
ncbi:RmlC-like cupin domain-containing protein [Mycena crocata]|nr:RmlC-like cupin domain-containing protein [Mycena crocata]